MKNLLTKKKNLLGFTIIEVLIVLAIAGLILVVVFLAVPQLQKSQRNNAAKQVMNRVRAEVDSYASDNQGHLPDNTTGYAFGNTAADTCPPTDGRATFTARYLSNVNLDDPKVGKGHCMGLRAMINSATPQNYSTWTSGPREIRVHMSTTATSGFQCQGENPTATGTTGPRQYAVTMRLEGGALYCVDNQ